MNYLRSSTHFDGSTMCVESVKWKGLLVACKVATPRKVELDLEFRNFGWRRKMRVCALPALTRPVLAYSKYFGRRLEDAWAGLIKAAK